MKITITDSNGVIIDQGYATGNGEVRPNQWEYKAGITNLSLQGTKIMAVAYDRPGNQGTATLTL